MEMSLLLTPRPGPCHPSCSGWIGCPLPDLSAHSPFPLHSPRYTSAQPQSPPPPSLRLPRAATVSLPSPTSGIQALRRLMGLIQEGQTERGSGQWERKWLESNLRSEDPGYQNRNHGTANSLDQYVERNIYIRKSSFKSR